MLEKKTEKIKFLREGDWYINKNKINLDQKIIEETTNNLRLKKCPVCKGELSHQDNFGEVLLRENNVQEGYCPKDNYLIRLEAHQYKGNTSGTELFIKIFTNSKYSKLMADSGLLTDFSSLYVRLNA